MLNETQLRQLQDATLHQSLRNKGFNDEEVLGEMEVWRQLFLQIYIAGENRKAKREEYKQQRDDLRQEVRRLRQEGKKIQDDYDEQTRINIELLRSEEHTSELQSHSDLVC